jgi:hypothetical protein
MFKSELCSAPENYGVLRPASGITNLSRCVFQFGSQEVEAKQNQLLKRTYCEHRTNVVQGSHQLMFDPILVINLAARLSR